MPQGLQHKSCLVLPQTHPCSQLCPPGPKDRPQGTLEEKYGASKLRRSLEIIKSNPCIHREKLRLRGSELIPRAEQRSPETLSSVRPFHPQAAGRHLCSGTESQEDNACLSLGQSTPAELAMLTQASRAFRVPRGLSHRPRAPPHLQGKPWI